MATGVDDNLAVFFRYDLCEGLGRGRLDNREAVAGDGFGVLRFRHCAFLLGHWRGQAPPLAQ